MEVSALPEQLRSDARSNRDQILAAALEVFRERGTEVPMKEIADRAGVGVGTLYRRFPDRDALMIGTAQAHLERLAEMAATAFRDEDSAWLALSRFLRECAEMRLGALVSAIDPVLHAEIQVDARLTEARTAVTDLVARMTAQAQTDGDLRTDIGPEDVALLMTVQVYTRAAESNSAAVRRVLTIVMDGLRPRS